MPFKCSVFGCKGNYNAANRVTVFSFPKDENLRRKWVRCIKRGPDFQPTSNTKVCARHFDELDIVREAELYNSCTGQLLTASLNRLRLRPDAYPTIIPDANGKLQHIKATRREDPARKRERREMEQLRKSLEFEAEMRRLQEERNQFKNLDDLENKLTFHTLPVNMSKIRQPNKLIFVELLTNCKPPTASKWVIVDDQLVISAFGSYVSLSRLGNHRLPFKNQKVDVLVDILHRVSALGSGTRDECKEVTREAISCLETLEKHVPEKLEEIKFIKEQIQRLNNHKNSLTYSVDSYILFGVLFTVSPPAYRFLRNSEKLSLPHPNGVVKVCSSFLMEDAKELDRNCFEHIKRKLPQDSTVLLVMKEVHIRPRFNIKDDRSAATKAHVFTIKSLSTSYRELVLILPAKNPQFERLHYVIEQVITKLESIGFEIVGVCTDSNVSTESMGWFNQPPRQNILYKHPKHDARPLFHLIDPIYLLKKVRNAWINMPIDDGKSFYFPNFDDFNVTEKASFDSLLKLVNSESSKPNLEEYGLSPNALQLVNLDKEDPKFVFQVFSQLVIKGLRKMGSRQRTDQEVEPDMKLRDEKAMIQDKEKEAEPSDKNTNQKNRQEYAVLSNLLRGPMPYEELESRLNVDDGEEINVDQEVTDEWNGTSNFIEIMCNWWLVFTEEEKLLTSSLDDSKFEFLNRFLLWMDRWMEMEGNKGKLHARTHLALTNATYATIEFIKYCCLELQMKGICARKFQVH